MKTIRNTIAILFIMLIMACKKEFLDKKPDDKLVVPSSLSDFQAILDNDRFMNGAKTDFGPDPSLSVAGTDDYYIPDDNFPGLNDLSKAVYTWSKFIPYGTGNKNWVGPYRVIFNANVVLEGLQKIEPSTALDTYNNIKGSALFFRAYQFHNLAQVFAPVYDAARAGTDLSIPLRLSPDISFKSVRSTVKETYERIIGDLNEALPLLPDKPLVLTRPSRQAAFGLLARVYLTMRDYGNALRYTDSCLKINAALLDYKTLSPSASAPLALFNTEVLFHCKIGISEGALSIGSTPRIDSALYLSYLPNDLRKKIFFKVGTDGKASFKGSYSGTVQLFSGLATDEIWLIQSECYARNGNVPAAMQSLNTLLQKRYDGTFTSVTAANQADALEKILTERRKELVMRNQRWNDLRRLNSEGKNIVLQRKVQGASYVLVANDNRYVWPIPDDVIGLTGIPQNPR